MRSSGYLFSNADKLHKLKYRPIAGLLGDMRFAAFAIRLLHNAKRHGNSNRRPVKLSKNEREIPIQAAACTVGVLGQFSKIFVFDIHSHYFN